MQKRFISKASFYLLQDVLVSSGYSVVGPKVKDNAVVFEELNSFDDLPWGWQEEVSPGSYKLQKNAGARGFAWNTGPQGIKPWLFKPEQTVWTAKPAENGFTFSQAKATPQQRAFIGVRSCDLAALSIQDRHFLHSKHPDPWYSAQRNAMLLIAVNCQRSASTCFCVSTGDGPEASYGYDLLLDELEDGFLIEAKSSKGAALIDQLDTEEVTQSNIGKAAEQIEQAKQQQRTLPEDNQLLKLLDNLDSEQWVAIAQKCLACGNCTMVCPTCFCSKQETEFNPNDPGFQQVRYWDSCFSEHHGYIAGKHIRGEISQRYRQWLTHKLATWQAQFERNGCVGCGRCISWCPVGIDLVEEVGKILEKEAHE